jgi:hypothetical protein
MKLKMQIGCDSRSWKNENGADRTPRQRCPPFWCCGLEEEGANSVYVLLIANGNPCRHRRALMAAVAVAVMS